MERPSSGEEWGLPPLAALVAGLADIGDPGEEGEGRALGIDEIRLETAMELDLRVAEDGTVTALEASTPTQWTETTIMPAFHLLRVRIGRTDHG